MIKKNKAVSVSMTETANTFASITHSKWSTVNAHSLSAVRGTDAAAEGFVLLPEEPIHMGVPTSTLAPAICNGSSGPPDMDHFAHPQNLTNEMIMKALDMTRAPSWRGHENAPSQRATAITKTQPPSSMLRKEVGTHTTSPKSHKTGNKVTDSKPFNMSEPKKKQFPLTKIDKRADEEEAEEDLVRKWQGTSARYPKAWLQSIPSDQLNFLIRLHGEAYAEVRSHPYHPQSWLSLSLACQAFHFSECQVQCAYNALLLCKSGLGLPLPHSLPVPNLQAKVMESVYQQMIPRLNLKPLIDGYLQQFHHGAWCALLSGLVDAEAMFEGLEELKKVNSMFPGDGEIEEVAEELRREWKEKRKEDFDSKLSKADQEHLSKVGSLLKRQYPWVDGSLFIRTPEMVERFNKELGSSFCEIRPLYPASSPGHTLEPGITTSLSQDIGPLGLFATRDMSSGTIIFVNHSTMCQSSIMPSKMTHCEACHTSLHSIHLPSSEVTTASCCQKAKYCSKKCLDYATGPDGYHTFICGKDLGWLYAPDEDGKMHESSKSLLVMHRILAIILAEQRHAESIAKDTGTPYLPPHPLQHPLLAQLTAGYPHDTSNPLETEHEWSYTVNIVRATQMLSTLGIDVFADPIWGGAGEFTHSIWWRIYNNACVSQSVEFKSVVLDFGGDFTEMEGGKRERDGLMLKDLPLSGIFRNFIFFNHACSPNVDWGSARPDEMEEATGKGKGLRLQVGTGKKRTHEWVKAGEAHMVCRLRRDVKEGEELRISYLPGTSDRRKLGKWFEGGCECNCCVAKSGIGFERGGAEGN